MPFICHSPQRDHIKAFVFMIKELFLKLYYLWITSQVQLQMTLCHCPKLPVHVKTLFERKFWFFSIFETQEWWKLLCLSLSLLQGKLKYHFSCLIEWYKWQTYSSSKWPLYWQKSRWKSSEIKEHAHNTEEPHNAIKLIKINQSASSPIFDMSYILYIDCGWYLLG